MSELLTKKQILEGRQATSVVHIDRLGGSVEIRALTDGDWAEVRKVMTQGVTMTIRRGETLLDGGQSAVNEHCADLMVCRLGLVESWTEAEMAKWPAGTASDISVAIQNLSGVSMDENKDNEIARAAQSFCDEPGGADDSVPAPDGPAADDVTS
jgi:hypothetical protein